MMMSAGPITGVGQRAPDGPEHDEVRYLVDPFHGVAFDDFAISAVRFDWDKMWSRGGDPM
jgi:hypothetical protein